MKLNPKTSGRQPSGAHGRAAVHALGRTKTTGNFAKIEAAKGKAAAIGAYQQALKAHKGGARHNGPHSHVAGGMHYGAHEGHSAITAQEGCCHGEE